MNPNLIWGPLKKVERFELFRSQYKHGRHTHLCKKDLSNILLKILRAFSCDPRVTLINLRPRPKIVSEYDQEIPQSQTTDNPVAP